MVQALFCDLLAESLLSPERYLALTRNVSSEESESWLRQYGNSVGDHLATAATLANGWPLALTVWLTSNEIDESFPTGWRHMANNLIRKANAAAAAAAGLRNVSVFGVLAEGAVPLRDLHHPAAPVSAAAMEKILDRMRQALKLSKVTARPCAQEVGL